MDIIIFVNSNDEDIFQRFLESFYKNCADKANVDIYAYMSSECNVIKQYPALKIHPILGNEWYTKYHDGILPIDILKLLAINNSHVNQICLFTPNMIFLRKFSLYDYINEYRNRLYYCSKATHSILLPDEIVERNKILEISDINDYHEVNHGIYDRMVCSKLLLVLINKYHFINNIPDFHFEEIYQTYRFSTSHDIILYDTYELLKDGLTDFDKLNSDKYINSVLLSLPEYSNNFSNIGHTIRILNILGLKMMHYLPNSINHQITLLDQSILIGYCQSCNLTNQMLERDAYNLRVGICVSGLLRSNDNLHMINTFMLHCPFDIYYYLASESKIIQKATFNQRIQLFNIDNNVPYKNATAKHVQPKTKSDMVSNTCAMFYKKRRIWEFVSNKKYDLIVSVRPDILPLDGQYMIHLIINAILHIDNNTLLIPKFYNSHGITDSLAFGNYHVMKMYMKLYDSIDTFLKTYYFNPEFILYKYLHDNGIKFSVFDFVYKIYWHENYALNFWWRYEFDIQSICNEYLELKTNSVETLHMRISNNKYIIMKDNQYLSVIGDKVVLSDKFMNTFRIRTHYDKCIRANLVFIPERKSARELLLSVKQNNNEVCLTLDQDDLNTQFYIYCTSCGIYFASIKSHSITNRLGQFGCYLGINGSGIVSDMEKCDKSKWIIREK